MIEQGGVVAAARAVVIVFEPYKRRPRAVALHVIHVNVFDKTAAVEVRFKVNGAQAFYQVYPVYINIPYTGRHFAADAKSVGFRSKNTIANDHVFGRLPYPPAILVAAGFNGYAIVARGKGTVLYQHIGAGLGVAAIIVQIHAVDGYILDGNIVTEHRMDNPVGRVDDGYTVDQHVFAAKKLDHIRRQMRSLAKNPFVYGRTIASHLP